jgi:transposase
MRQVVFGGVDVSAKELVVAVRKNDGGVELLRFRNDADGHQKLIRRVTKGGRSARVALESTGVYGLDLALALHGAGRVEVTVANPRSVKDFGDALLKRTKTDPEDAVVILEYLERMPFEAWCPPSDNALILRSIARRITAMKQTTTAEKNRLHAAEFLAAASPVIRRDIEVNLRHLIRRIDSLAKHAVSVVRSDKELSRQFDLLVTVKGIAETSAVQILGELAVLPADMTARQWVAQAGLDPRHHSSGTSVNKPARISKVGNQRMRAGLYMPSLVAIRCEPYVHAYSQRLIERGKKPLQAVTAVMRKLLHSIHAMFRLNVPFDPKKFARTLDFQESA